MSKVVLHENYNLVMIPVCCCFCEKVALHMWRDGWRTDKVSHNWICPECIALIKFKRKALA